MKWVIDSLKNQNVITTSHWYKRKRLDSDKLNFCSSCKMVWENDCLRGSAKQLYYEDFPSRGLERNKCRKCNEQEI